MMVAVTPTPSRVADLATAVRTGQWAEVRRQTEAMPPPLPSATALVAARAARALGQTNEALRLLLRALPHAGGLAPALDFEAAEVSLALGRDPWPHLRRLLSRPTSAAQRHAAEALVREAAEGLPLRLARVWLHRSLRTSLRREVASILAERSGSESSALALLAKRNDDAAATRAARWLAGRPGLSPVARVDVAGALLTGGRWRDAEELLVKTHEPAEPGRKFRYCYLRGRAAYRLGSLADAEAWFTEASEAAQRPADRFAAGVQRARLAEISGDYGAALALWEDARASQPREVEGWDGAARARAVLGRDEEAVASLRRAPAAVVRIAGPRLAAQLLLRGRLRTAEALLAGLPPSLPAVRVLRVALDVREGRLDRARTEAAEVIADRRSGPWRELVLGLLPVPPDAGATVQTVRDPSTLATVAASRGLEEARGALARALASDPDWARLLAGGAPLPPEWSGPAHDLAAVGLEAEAAALFPDSFPDATPEELAWSASTLAAWGNAPAALTKGEQLWGELDVPATLLPSAVLEVVLPPALVAPCRDAARSEGVRADWLVGVIRVESRFDARARSSAGALGVGQIMPELARRHGVAEVDLWDPARAYRLAALELARLERRFGPRLEVVAAAYNAGEKVVASWLAASGLPVSPPEGAGPSSPQIDPLWTAAVFTAAIPYGETASYVLAVQQGAALARVLPTASVASPASAAGSTTAADPRYLK